MDEDTPKHMKLRSTCSQFLAALAFKSLVLNTGIIVGMPVIVIGALTSPGANPLLTQDEASWFASLFFIVRPFATVVSGFLQDSLGRKLSMLLVNIPLLVSWIAMYYTASSTTLFVSAVVMGLSLGFAEAPALTYVSEVCEPRLRGVLSSLGSILFNVGIMIPAFIGAFTDWRTMMLICAVFPVITFLGLLMVPESPAWLVSKGRVTDARRAYQWLRGWVQHEVIKEELDDLVAYVKQDRKKEILSKKCIGGCAESDKEDHSNSKIVHEGAESKLAIFLHPSVQRPFRLVMICFLISACASLTAMRPFLIQFLKRLELPIRPHLVNVYSSCLNFFGSITAPLAIRTLGKRGSVFVSLGLCVPCCLGLGLYLYLGLQWHWIALIFFFVVYYSAPLGIYPVPWILMSEVYPLRWRGVACGITAAAQFLLLFSVTKTYINIVSLVGESGACMTYGMVGLLGMVYLYWNLPETEGVSLAEIEKMFYKKNSAETTRESTR